ncbi:Crp/Fnr family transcriptional regulator [Micromonospora tulbaghiae]|uniref:Crp/Fnr family transcriptional regulator n=1 Tax=Micromonospora tulbaghiae TaxID=479978 RepID=UPI00365EACB9
MTAERHRTENQESPADQEGGCAMSRGLLSLGEQLRYLVQDRALSATTMRVPKHSHIYNCGERDGNIYLVESGQVRTVSLSRDGKRCLLSVYTEGDVFGELCILRENRIETATAMTPVALRRIPKTRLLEAVAEAGLQGAFIRHLTGRLSEQQQIITTLVTMDSEQRLATILLRLARKLGKRQGEYLCIVERISQEELAWMVGTTRSRVGYFLKRFHDAGFVRRTRESYLLVHEELLTGYVQKLM